MKKKKEAFTTDLLGYSPWGHKEIDTTERLTLSLKLLKT